MGYPTYWFDANDDTDNFDFSHPLFITEGQVDQNIPIRFDCQYILHNCSHAKYQDLLQASLAIMMQVYGDAVLLYPTFIKVAPCTYYDIAGKCVYLPWGSDYLPQEIEDLKILVADTSKQAYVPWIGTLGGGTFGNDEELSAFKRACEENGISFVHHNPWSRGLEREACTQKLLSAYMAPAIVGHWQQENGYIPCRIFINICCGQMGMTNSRRVFELFEEKIVYNPDCYQLFYDAQKRQESWTLEEQYELMDLIKEKHTYLNRVQTLLEFLKLIQEQEPYRPNPA